MEGIEDNVLMDILCRAVGPERTRIAFDALSLPPSVSIRLNPYKFRSDEPSNRVPWCEYGMMLPERPKFVMDPLFHAGCYYVQDSSAMVVGHILGEHLDRFEGLGPGVGSVRRPRRQDDRHRHIAPRPLRRLFPIGRQ